MSLFGAFYLRKLGNSLGTMLKHARPGGRQFLVYPPQTDWKLWRGLLASS